MINHNALLYELLDRTISISAFSGIWDVNYTEGDLFELTKKLNDSKTKYPIIWLQTGYKVKHDLREDKTHLEGCKMFFITKGDLNDRYEKRYDTTYKEVLYPLLEKYKKVLMKSDGVKMNPEYSFVTFPFNDTNELNRREINNGTKTPSQSATITDIWDALVLENDLTIENCHYEQFKI